MKGIYYFPFIEKNENRWPDRLDNKIYKVMKYNQDSNEVKTVARGATLEDSARELFSNIDRRIFPFGKISQELMVSTGKIRETTYKECHEKEGMDNSKIIPLSDQEFDNFLDKGGIKQK